MDWYAAARAALLGAAAMAYLISLYLLVRSTAAGWRATPVPRTTPLMLLHLPLTGVHVTVLTFVAIGQASRIAQEEVRAAARGKLFSGAHLFYLENAAELAWTYAVLFTVAGTIALALAVIAWRAGDHPALAAALGVAGLPFLLLLLVVSAGTPFMLSGAADEPVPSILGSGPDWYFPAILTQTALGAPSLTSRAWSRSSKVYGHGEQALRPLEFFSIAGDEYGTATSWIDRPHTGGTLPAYRRVVARFGAGDACGRNHDRVSAAGLAGRRGSGCEDGKADAVARVWRKGSEPGGNDHVVSLLRRIPGDVRDRRP